MPRTFFCNKLGIRDQRMLGFVEAQLSAVRIYEEVLESRSGAFDFNHYCDIHRRLFAYNARRPRRAHRSGLKPAEMVRLVGCECVDT